MNIFDRYPQGGQELLGRPRSGNGTCRSGYGLALQRLTGESNCAYCGVSLIDDYYHWLLMSIDHVVPSEEARRLGIGPEFFEDAINLVLCCSGCNGFGNRYRCSIDSQELWTLDEFLTLRNAIFEERFGQIAARRAAEIATFESHPWALSRLNPSLPLSAVSSRDDQSGYMEGPRPMRTFVDDDAG